MHCYDIRYIYYNKYNIYYNFKLIIYLVYIVVWRYPPLCSYTGDVIRRTPPFLKVRIGKSWGLSLHQMADDDLDTTAVH